MPFRILAALIRYSNKQAEKLRANQTPIIANQKPMNGLKEETHKVAGVSYRQDAIKSLGVKNPNFVKTERTLMAEGLTDEWIYEYKFNPRKVELVPEPDNPHSKNGKAVKVVVDGQHIGYIKSGSSAHVYNLIGADRIQRIDCFIGGGRSKILTQLVDDDYELVEDEFLFYARLTLYVKTE